MTGVAELADLALAAAAAAAAKHAERVAGVQFKASPGDLVTSVDLAAEQAAVAAIRAARPGDAIVGEESGGAAAVAGITWYVDGLDGTANWVRGYPAHAVSVGATSDGRPAAGAVVDTAQGVTYRGAVGEGATRDGAPLAVAAPRPLDAAVIGTGFAPDRLHRARQADVLAAILPAVGDVRRSGSPALDLAAVAAGELDGYFEIGLGPWDYAAGRVLVEAAGGRVEVVDCAPWRGPLVVAGPVAIVDALVARLAAAGVPMGGASVDPVATVVAGYDRLASRYDAWAGQVTPDHRGHVLDWLDTQLAPGDPVLELGPGTGVPVAARLAGRYEYLGVDASAGMVRRAERNTPGAAFRVADMRTLDFPAGSFAAVVAFYSIIHVPRADQPALFAAMRRWLWPAGVFAGSLHAGDEPAGTDDDWLGAGPMYWSGFAADVNVRLLEDAGFGVVAADVHTQQEPDGEVRFLFVTARAR